MSIYVICGDPGAGKSAFCVPLMERYAKNDPRPILSTFWTDVPGVEVVTWPEMCRRSGAICFVDEAADLYNSRDAIKGENKNGMALFREHRKDGLTLFLVTQGFDMLDTNIRQMTRYVWHIKRMFGPDFYENESVIEKRIGVWSRARCYLAKTFTKEDTGHKKRVCLRTSYFRVDALYDRFDTLAKSAGLHGDKNTRGLGLASGSALAAERRRGKGRRQPRRLPDWAYPLVGVPVPPRLARRTPMLFTQAEYLAWTHATADRCGHGITRWLGPENLETYDRLPEELQVHKAGGPMPTVIDYDLSD